VCETKFVAVEVNQMFGLAGRGSWLAPRRECTFVKSINVGDVKDHAPTRTSAAQWAGRRG
jgi:hypothetical protein